MADRAEPRPKSALAQGAALLGLPQAGIYKVFANYGSWRAPDSASATELSWSPEHAWPPHGIQIGRGVLDVQYYRLHRATLSLPSHFTEGDRGASEGQPVLELTLSHEWVNATSAVLHSRRKAEKRIEEHVQNASAQERAELSQQWARVSRDATVVAAQQVMWSRASDDEGPEARHWLDQLAKDDAVLRSNASVAAKLEGELRQAEQQAEEHYEALRLVVAQIKALLGQPGVAPETIDKAAGNLSSASRAWLPAPMPEKFEALMQNVTRDFRVMRSMRPCALWSPASLRHKVEGQAEAARLLRGGSTAAALPAPEARRLRQGEAEAAKELCLELLRDEEEAASKVTNFKSIDFVAPAQQRLQEARKHARETEQELQADVQRAEESYREALTSGDMDAVSSAITKRDDKRSKLQELKKNNEDAMKELQKSYEDKLPGLKRRNQEKLHDLKRAHENVISQMKDAWSLHMNKLATDISSLDSCLSGLHALDTLGVHNAAQCPRQLPLPPQCLASSPRTAHRLRSLEGQMLEAAWTIAMTTRDPVHIIVPIVASASAPEPPWASEMLKAFTENPPSTTSAEPLWALAADMARGYTPVPGPNVSGLHPSWRAEAHIVVQPLHVPKSWLDKALQAVHDQAEALTSMPSEPMLHLEAQDMQMIEVHDEPAESLIVGKPQYIAEQDRLGFLMIVACSCTVIMVTACAVEVYKKWGSSSTWFEFLFKTNLAGERQPFTDEQRATYLVISSLLLLMHVGLLIFIPLYGMGEARCMSGYDWRKHDVYAIFQWQARMVELAFYAWVGGAGAGLFMVLFKLAMGCAGGLDYYTDATFVTIARICEGGAVIWGMDLWLVSLIAFAFSVLLMQVVIPVVLAVRYPQRRVILLMRLNQHDLIAEYYNPFGTPDNDDVLGGVRLGGGFQKLKSLLSLVLCIMRLLLEDFPQMYLQYAFKSSLPLTNHGMIWFSLGVGAVSGIGGLAAAVYDFIVNCTEQLMEEPGGDRADQGWVAFIGRICTAICSAASACAGLLEKGWVACMGFICCWRRRPGTYMAVEEGGGGGGYQGVRPLDGGVALALVNAQQLRQQEHGGVALALVNAQQLRQQEQAFRQNVGRKPLVGGR